MCVQNGEKMNWQTRQTLLQRAKDPNDAEAWEEFVSYYKTIIPQVDSSPNELPTLDFDDAVFDREIK